MNTDHILQLIPTGKNQAIQGPDLVTASGLPDERTLRAAIAKLRADGEIICSGSRGYYRPESDDEITEYVQMMERHAKSCFLAIRSARAKLREIDGKQLTIDDALNIGGETA